MKTYHRFRYVLNDDFRVGDDRYVSDSKIVGNRPIKDICMSVSTYALDLQDLLEKSLDYS